MIIEFPEDMPHFEPINPQITEFFDYKEMIYRSILTSMNMPFWSIIPPSEFLWYQLKTTNKQLRIAYERK
jgi:hypothetical protein